MLDKIVITINPINNDPGRFKHIETNKFFQVKRLTSTGYVALYKNLRLIKKHDQLKIEGSIAKWWHGTNAFNTDKALTKLIIKSFIKELQLKPTTIIQEIEFGFNVSLAKSPKVYINQLKRAKGYSKMLFVMNKQVSFIKNNRRIRIYDKTQHFYNSLSFNSYLPSNLNILRYEVVLIEPKSNFDVKSPLQLAHLMSSITLDYFICLWLNEFSKIYFEPIVLPKIAIKTPSNFKNHLMLKGMESYGGLTKTLNLIEALEVENNEAQYKKRLRDLIVKLGSESSLTKCSDVATELRDKTLFTGLYYLSQK